MKDFDNWNKLKKVVHKKKRKVFIKEREIRFTHLGVNVGFEQNGAGTTFARPVLVIKRIGNQYFVVPMTSKGKDNKFYHKLPDNIFGHTSRLILSQVKTIDKKRFIREIGTVPKEEFLDIKKKLKAFLL